MSDTAPGRSDMFTFNRPSNIKDEFVGGYSQGWFLTENSPYRSAAEDFASSFTMYITQGKVFREIAKSRPILLQKYNWLKQNVFEGIEYQSGTIEGIIKIKENPTASYMSTGAFSTRDYSQADPDFVWNYKFRDGSLSLDSDNDRLPDEFEEFYGSDPSNPDSDGDGFLDGEEVRKGFSPIIAEATAKVPEVVIPTPISVPTPQRLYLARAEGSSKVYYISDSGYKKWIRNTEIFNSYNNKWDDIAVVSQKDLAAYPDINLIRVKGGERVYKLEGNTKIWIKTAEIFNKLGYDWGAIHTVNETEFDFYSEGSAIDS